ncbi:MAG: hypothetical protein H7A42_06125 [Chlamydiales bacterium]|nr:hypothetical protein [Chlamydiales bacterium]
MSGNVGLSCWQQFWNCICCCCPYEEPEAIQQRKPLLKDPLHSTTSPTTSSHTSSPPSSNAHTLSPDLTLGLPAHQVEIQTGEHQDREKERKISSDDLRHLRVVSSHSPKANGQKNEGTGSPPSSLLPTRISTPPLDEQQQRKSEDVTTLSLSHLPPHDQNGSPSLSERDIHHIQKQGSGSSSPLPRPDQRVFRSPRPYVAKDSSPPSEEIKDQFIHPVSQDLLVGSSLPVVSDEVERRNSPPIPIPIEKKRESDHSRSSDEEEHTPPHSFVSNPTTPVQSPGSRPTTPLSSPYNDTSFGNVSNWRDQVGIHESPHKMKDTKQLDGSGSDTD